MRKLEDANNAVLQKILDALVSENVDITAREIARRHPHLKHASTFTRNAERLELIGIAQRSQIQAREIAAKISGSQTSLPLREDEQIEVAVLQRQVQILVAAHAGLIRSVQLAGGMAALERFWNDYKEISGTIQQLDAGPREAAIVSFPRGA